MKETIPHVAHASTLIQLIKDLVHEIKKTSGVGSTLSIVLARATSRLAPVSYTHLLSPYLQQQVYNQ